MCGGPLGDIEEDLGDGLDHMQGGSAPVGLGYQVQQDRKSTRRHQHLAATL